MIPVKVTDTDSNYRTSPQTWDLFASISQDTSIQHWNACHFGLWCFQNVLSRTKLYKVAVLYALLKEMLNSILWSFSTSSGKVSNVRYYAGIVGLWQLPPPLILVILCSEIFDTHEDHYLQQSKHTFQLGAQRKVTHLDAFLRLHGLLAVWGVGVLSVQLDFKWVTLKPDRPLKYPNFPVGGEWIVEIKYV